MNPRTSIVAFLALVLAWLPDGALAGSTLDAVKARGALVCGTVELGVGLASQDASGRWIGFFPDFCRALAAAVLSDPERVEIVNVSLSNRFSAVAQGAVDVLVTGTTWTLGRDVDLHLAYPALYLFDGQSFMSHRSENITVLADLKGKSVCVPKGTTTLPQTREIAAAASLMLEIREYESVQGAYAAFFGRQCAAVTDDATRLAANRAMAGFNPAEYVILARQPIKELLYPVVRKDDEGWFDIVRWVINATIMAEELGVTSANIDILESIPDSATGRFLGRDPRLGGGLGLDPKWAYRVVKAVGNFGEIFDRNLGEGSALKLSRGFNNLWNHGGVLWAPPLQ